ncbi:E3 ubiquitin-protein ligase TRIM35 [Astyanax mexicanus]|uniref:E3 ubiquitin-protein ligase TRIM35 n=1 Tax=Astyanax mexicanus TaxID=7994 RepID=UPI0020CB2673|nr:E3 ubiquitin-protein ligase TRIM35 [Astyanax mexicanus]
MAGKSFSDEDFACPVCYEIFTEPVVLLCSHTICKACLTHSWEEKGFRECPICRKISLIADPPCNLALKNLCEAFLKERSQRSSQGPEIRCNLHNELLKLFCLVDQQPICVVCRDSNKHQTHSCRTADEAAVDLKEELRRKLKPLLEKLKVFEDFLQKCTETAEHTKFQAEKTEKQIKEDFSKLHQFLQQEEAARIAVLRAENEQKGQMLKKKIEEMNREILCLTATIRSVTEQIQADHISFLQRYKATLKRTQCNLKDPETLSGALIDVAKHLGNLKFRVWEKMKDMVKYNPVTMDPNTAHSSLYVSHDLSSMRLNSVQQACPANPERFSFYQVLLSSEVFGPGCHYWDVEVGKCEEWALGVCTESAHRGERFLESGVWRVWYCSGVYRADSPEKRYVTLRVKQRIQRVRVLLDWSGGQLLFIDPLTNKQLHSFTHSFTERVYATFANGSSSHFLRILPLRACLILKDSSTV